LPVAITTRDRGEAPVRRLALPPPHACPQDDDVANVRLQHLRKPVEMLVALGEDQRRAPRPDAVHDILADAARAGVVVDQRPTERLKLQALVSLRSLERLECRGPHQHPVLKRPDRGLRARIDAMPNRTALHEDDRMMAILARDGGGEACHKSRLGLPCHLLEAARWQVVAFVDYELTVIRYAVVDYARPGQTLDYGHVDKASRTAPAAADAADRLRRQVQKHREPFDPLVEQLAPMNEHECAHAALGDQPCADHRLAERGRGCQHASVVCQQGLRRPLLLGPQPSLEGRRERPAAAALVANRRGNPQIAECKKHVVEAAPRQSDVMREVLSTGDDARCAIGRKPQRLGLVERGILERRKPQQPVAQPGRQAVLGDVDLVAEHQLDRLRQRTRDRQHRGASRGRQAPGLVLVVLLRRQADAEDAAPSLGDPNRLLDLLPTEPVQACEEGPLIDPRIEIGVEKDAVPQIPRRLLQRQRDHAAEAALRHRVLAREEPVVGVEAELRPPFHRLGKHVRTEAAGERRRYRLLEEEPQMRAQAGARALESRRNLQTPAAFEAGCRVLPPAALVEIDGQEPAGLVRQQRIDTGHERLSAGIRAREVPADDLVGQRQKSAVRAVGAFDARLLANAADPFVRARGRIAVLAGPAALEAARIDVLAAAEQRAEQPDIGLHWRVAIDGWFRVHDG
jgi:hypothetical protein